MLRLPLTTIAVSLVAIWLLSPVLAYSTTARVFSGVAIGIWMFREALRVRGIFSYASVPVLLAAFYGCYILMIEMLVDDSSTINRHYQVLILLFFLFVQQSYRLNAVAEFNNLFWIVLLILPIWISTTLLAQESLGDNVVRLVIRSDDTARELSGQGVGGYSLVYSLLLALPVLWYFSIFPKRVDWSSFTRFSGFPAYLGRALVLANLVLALLLILRAGYAIAVALALISLVAVFMGDKGRASNLVFAVLVFSVVAALTGLFSDSIVQGLLQISRGTLYENKVAHTLLSLGGQESVGTFELRSERYLRSILLFLGSPFWGTLSFDSIGKHSAYLDNFAQYGILVGAVFMYLLMFLPIRFLRQCEKHYGLALAIFIVALSFPMLNNVFGAYGLILFIFIPGALSLLDGSGSTQFS
ncbi:MAG: hypothetical protein O7F73_01630 [Gammaproteobacteria bacterium]|nr:hypothetical protein [Gammaproteobacteria bacterium]